MNIANKSQMVLYQIFINKIEKCLFILQLHFLWDTYKC